MQCWYSYSYRNDRYVFGQGGMTCLRSSKIPLIPSKTKYPLGKHPNNLMPHKIIPRYGLRANLPDHPPNHPPCAAKYSSSTCTSSLVYVSVAFTVFFRSTQNMPDKTRFKRQNITTFELVLVGSPFFSGYPKPAAKAKPRSGRSLSLGLDQLLGLGLSMLIHAVQSVIYGGT